MKKFAKVTVMMVVAVMLTVSLSAAAQDAAQKTNAELATTVAKEMEAKNLSAAITVSRELEASNEHDGTWEANTSTLPRLLWQAGKRDEAVAFLKACAAEPKRSPGRTAHISFACNQLWGDMAYTDVLLAIDVDVVGDTGHNVHWRYNQLVSQKKYDAALAILLEKAMKVEGLGPEWARYERLRLLTQLRRTDAAATEALEYVKIATHPMQAATALQYLLPGNDASLCAGLTAQQVLDGYKLAMRRDTGKLNSGALVALANQLTKGGDARPLVVTDAAKALADKLDGVPLADYLQPLLRGDHAGAFRAAYERAKAADSDADHILWINTAAGAIRANDQHYNGRALDFVKYINGELNENPVVDLEKK